MIEPLQSYLLNSILEQYIFASAECISSCVEMLAKFGDRALQPAYDLWASVDFHGRGKIHVDLTKTYEDVRIAPIVGPDADVTLSSGSPERLLPQWKRPAQGPRFDLIKNSKAVAAKACVSKVRFSRPGGSGDAC